MPESIKSCGELIAPPARMTSRPAKASHRVAAAGRVFHAYSAMTVQQYTVDQRADFDAEIGAAKRRSQVSDAALHRRPSRIVTCRRVKPSCWRPLKSSVQP